MSKQDYIVMWVTHEGKWYEEHHLRCNGVIDESPPSPQYKSPQERLGDTGRGAPMESITSEPIEAPRATTASSRGILVQAHEHSSTCTPPQE